MPRRPAREDYRSPHYRQFLPPVIQENYGRGAITKSRDRASSSTSPSRATACTSVRAGSPRLLSDRPSG